LLDQLRQQLGIDTIMTPMLGKTHCPPVGLPRLGGSLDRVITRFQGIHLTGPAQLRGLR
jgi:hypothetical protein